MSGGWWTSADGSRRWIEEAEPKWEPTVTPLPAELIAPQERTSSTFDGEAWQPGAVKHAPIVPSSALPAA
jgi:hypothetical protein